MSYCFFCLVSHMSKSGQLNLQALELLIEILRTNQLSAAAESLRINTCTASRQLNDMREALEDPLFLRNGKGLVPTARMLELEPILVSILQKVHSLKEAAVFSPATVSGRFRILCYDNALLIYIVPILGTVRSQAPGLVLEFGFVATTEQLLEELRDGKADLAIFPVPPKRTDVIARDLPVQRYRLLMRKNHPLTKLRRTIAAEDLRPYTQICPGTRDARPWSELRDSGIGTIAIPYFNTAPFAVEKSDFVMWMPAETAQYWLRLGTLAVCDIAPEIAYKFSPKLIWNSRSEHDPLHQWIRSLILTRQQPIGGSAAT